MYVLGADETNRVPTQNIKFFVYGGLILPVESLVTLHERIEEIRRNAGYQALDVLKFDTNARPSQVTVTAAKEAKKQVVEACNDLGAKLIVYVILHEIMKNQQPDQHLFWAADYVIGRFNTYLQENDDHGICMVDNLPVNGQWAYYTRKFSIGLELPKGAVRLDRIKLFGASAVGAGHLNVAVDIVLGGFRYCVNESAKEQVAVEIMRGIVPMLWCKDTENGPDARGRGLILRPKLEDIKDLAYRKEYEDLLSRLRQYASAK